MAATSVFPLPALDSDDDEYMEDKPFSIDGSKVIEANQSEDKNELRVVGVEFSESRNAESHHTEEYEDQTVKRIVFRRGEHFDMNITFSRPYDKKKDDIRLIFAFGTGRKGHVELSLTNSAALNKWGATLMNQHEKISGISVRINTPPTLYVGKWKFSLDVMKKEEGRNVAVRYNHPEPIYMLFNPWCKDDQVYMKDTNLLQEYILNDTGNVYTITEAEDPWSTPWNFGQFDPPVLECAMYLLDDMSGLTLAERSDPIMVVRRLSALANGNDENGVLTGRWEEPYEGGQVPGYWCGSHEIIQQYYETKTTVKFGQCWVFSGVLTTLCRTIGIPTRSVTNYESAHDIDGSMTIDTYFDKYLKLKKPKDGSDTVWDFHVWNEVWMARPDLPDGYGGWQALDATPQEESNGVSCCGPMSVTAIRRGKVTLPYDGTFIFAEVNSDRVNWIEDEQGSFRKLRITRTNDIGVMICTKKPKCNIIGNEDETEFLTDNYKYREGTELERMSVIAANACGSVAEHNIYDVKDEDQDVDFKFELVKKEFTYGKPYELKVKITNNSNTKRTIHGLIHSSTTFYTGVNYRKVKSERFDITLGADNSTKVYLKVSFDEYKDNLTDHCCFHHYCSFKVEETRQIFVDQINVSLAKPRLNLKATADAKVGQELEVELTFENPLPIALTECVLTVEGPGISKSRMVPQGNINAHETFAVKSLMKPSKKGARQIVARFNCKQLHGIVGSCDIVVQK